MARRTSKSRRLKAELEEELDQRTQELRDSEGRFSAIFNQAAVGIVLSAPDGRWMRANQKLCEILGYDESEIADLRLQSVAHPDDADSHLDLMARLKAGEIPSYEEEKRLIRKDGSVTWVYITVSLVRDDEGKPDYFVAIIEHIWRRVQTLEALRESEKTKRPILSSAEDSILLLGLDGTVLEANEAGAERLGTTADELIGKCIYDFMPSEIAAARQARQPRLERGEVMRFEDEREGTLFDNRVYPILDDSGRLEMIVVFARDVTERKRANAALRQSEERYRKLVEISPHGIRETDLDGTFTFSNPAHHKILGCAQGEVPGMALWDFVESETEKAEMRRQVAILVNEQPPPTPYVARIKAKDGREVDIEVDWNYKRDDTGRLEGFVAVVTDVTERKRAERELIGAKEAAEYGSRAKSEFLANTSHELRTPLNAIIGFTDMLAGGYVGQLGAKQAEYVSDIRASGNALLETINDILDLTKIESGQATLAEETIDVVPTVQAAVRLIRERAIENRLTLRTDIAEDLPLLLADVRMVKRILLNLLSNAVKFTPAGCEVTLTAAMDEDGGLCFSVRDNGIGIGAENLPKVMEPFAQVDSTLSRYYRGTGLGLPLVKTMSDLHGGSFDLESGLGVGTTATVRFPPERMVGRDEAQPASRAPAR